MTTFCCPQPVNHQSFELTISQFTDDKPKPPTTEPAALVPKDSNSVAEDDAPWRRSGSLRTRAQQESPPKTREFSCIKV